ncbi:MAG: hypothetical protein Q8P29_02135 [Candidatus Levybacteria bacterium]|nr:hypothetical protein [Candidatus Levybacteria bacterium]
MLSKNHPIILFIDRFGFSVYQDILANIPKFNFTPDLVSNLDVVSKEQFVNIITTFIQINKIIPSSLAVILSDDVIYIRDLKNPVQKTTPTQEVKIDINDDKEHEDEVQNFLENIPFEEVLAKVIKTENVNRIVAVNKDLVMAIINTFVSKGSVIEVITPSFMYGQSANFTTGLTLDNIRVILENTEILKLGNLLINQEKIIPSQDLGSELKNSLADVSQSLTNDVKKPQNLRQYMLIGLFVTLLVIFVVVYLNLGASQTPPLSSKAKSVSENTVSTTTVIPTLTQALVTIAPVDIKSIKIIIVQNSQMDEKATNLKNGLLNIGFQDIVNEISEISIPEKSSVIFSPSIPAEVRNDIIERIKKILPEVSILENQDSDFTINIIVGKS